MSARQAAVLGCGQTKYKTSRSDAGTPELVYEAVSRAIADADVEMREIDAIVFASAPEVFEGVYEPERWCIEGFAGVGKPLLRVHTGGATGGSGPIAAGSRSGHSVGDPVHEHAGEPRRADPPPAVVADHDLVTGGAAAAVEQAGDPGHLPLGLSLIHI